MIVIPADIVIQSWWTSSGKKNWNCIKISTSLSNRIKMNDQSTEIAALVFQISNSLHMNNTE